MRKHPQHLSGPTINCQLANRTDLQSPVLFCYLSTYLKLYTMREYIMIAVLLLNVYFIVVSLVRIDRYRKNHVMSTFNRNYLIYISLLIPVAGFLLTRRMR